MGCSVIAGAIFTKDDKILLIQEGLDFCYGKWNLPAGKVDFGEGLTTAAKREALEETGYVAEPRALLGIYNFLDEREHHVIMFNFLMDITGGEIKFDGQEVINVTWLSFDEVRNMKDSEFRNAKSLRKFVQDAEQGFTFPIQGLKELC